MHYIWIIYIIRIKYRGKHLYPDMRQVLTYVSSSFNQFDACNSQLKIYTAPYIISLSNVEYNQYYFKSKLYIFSILPYVYIESINLYPNKIKKYLFNFMFEDPCLKRLSYRCIWRYLKLSNSVHTLANASNRDT